MAEVDLDINARVGHVEKEVAALAVGQDATRNEIGRLSDAMAEGFRSLGQRLTEIDQKVNSPTNWGWFIAAASLVITAMFAYNNLTLAPVVAELEHRRASIESIGRLKDDVSEAEIFIQKLSGEQSSRINRFGKIEGDIRVLAERLDAMDNRLLRRTDRNRDERRDIRELMTLTDRDIRTDVTRLMDRQREDDQEGRATATLDKDALERQRLDDLMSAIKALADKVDRLHGLGGHL